MKALITVRISIVTTAFLLVFSSSFSQEKKKRVFRSKEASDSFMTENFSKIPVDSFILKFTEGTRVRLRGKQFLTFKNSARATDAFLLVDNGLNSERLNLELKRLNELFDNAKNMAVKRLFTRPEDEIDREQDTLENKIREELSDLNLYYVVVSRAGDAKPLIRSLNTLKIVENAYPVYRIENAFIKKHKDRLNTVELKDLNDSSASQDYLNPAPKGVDAKYGWTFNGGKGASVKIIDIEFQWDIHHEDLKSPFWISSSTVVSNGYPSGDHGTAVLGELVAQHNHFGINGIVPEASYGLSEVSNLITHNRSVSAAIDKSATRLNAGDIILIEQHTPGPSTGAIDSDCNPSQFEYVPMEFYQDCFDAIRRATAKGIIVVEAGGNGGVNLDAPIYRKLFDKTVRDSKAIMVAADQGGNGFPACWTNYGKRIDFFAWGDNIVTTGYGDLEDNLDRHKKYTAQFGGTSGASPIIVGTIACIQGIRKKIGLPVWTAESIRANFIGTPQIPGNKFIGIMPDLKIIIDKMLIAP